MVQLQSSNPAHVTFVIFGGTGDLTKKKLVPAFAQLLKEQTLTSDSVIVGIARGDFTHDTYKAMLLENARTTEEKDAIRHATILFYRADSSRPGALSELPTLLNSFEKSRGHQRIFYLATSYNLFSAISENLVDAKLNVHTHGVKIVFEKPFGSDLKSAKKMEKKMHVGFSEDQIYRIDHYLGKETVQNIILLKYGNPFIESLFSNDCVSKIEIIAHEEAGVGSRLGYYNGVGVIKDMIQSHLLQVAALVLMKSPDKLTAESIRDAKVAVLKKMKLTGVADQVVGEYHSFANERSEANLPDLKTETFARLTFNCNNKQWAGVPIIIQSGKKLNKKYGQVIVHFKNVRVIEKIDGFENAHHNKLVIDIHPTEDIQLFVNLKKRVATTQLEYLPLLFSAQNHYGPNTTDGYKRLLNDVIIGEKTLFTRLDEVLASWSIVAPTQNLKTQIRHVVYPDGSNPEDIV